MQNLISHLAKILPQIIADLPAAVAVLFGAFVINFIVNRGLSLLAHKTHLTSDGFTPFRRAARWVVFAIALVLLLEIFGVNLGGIWSMLSAILAIIGIGFFAVWSILSNMLCTFVILIFHPFAVGDEVEFAGEPVRGKVVDLNFIYTTLQCDDGSQLQIPNNFFFQKVVKRRHGGGTIPLTTQLNSRTPAQLS